MTICLHLRYSIQNKIQMLIIKHSKHLPAGNTKQYMVYLLWDAGAMRLFF